MSDPLSIAGSAVGIASLGMQVSQGLSWYLRSIKGREHEINTGQKDIKTLLSIRSSLISILCLDDDGIIGECLKGSAPELQELRDLLKELEGATPTSLKNKIKDAGRSIIYPFREGKLTSLRQTLQRELDNLNLAVATTTLKHSAARDHKIDTIQTTVEAIRDEFRTCDVDRRLAYIQTSTASGMQEMYNKMSQLMDEKFREHRPKESERISVGLISLMPPSSSRPQEDTSPLVGRRAIATSDKATPRICDCSLASQAVTHTNTFFGIKIRYDQPIPGKHRSDCKFYGINGKIERTIEVQFSLKMKWLFASITRASIILTTGNGLGVLVRLKNFVPTEYSPFYLSANALRNSISPWEITYRGEPEEITQALLDFRHEVFSIYREGKASPNDRDEFGRTHLQILLDKTHYAMEEILANDSIAAVYTQLLCDLANIVPSDGEKLKLAEIIYRSGFGHRDNWRTFQSMISGLARVFEIDLELISNSFTFGHYYDVASTLMHSPDLIAVLSTEFHPIAGAILSQSLEDLESIILRDPESPMMRILNLTTIQLCVFWPKGLRILLQTRAKILINVGCSSNILQLQSPIWRAVRFNYVESVDILMKAGCQWDTVMWISGLDGLGCLPCELDSVIASNLAERRRNLLRWAEKELRIPRHADLSYVPDNIAADLCRDLDLAGVSPPSYLKVSQSYETIYHFPGYPFRLFPIFHQMGFRDYAVHNKIGLTPVMVWREPYWNDPSTLLTLLWMCEQGLLDQKVEDPMGLRLNVHATGWHYIALMFGRTYHRLAGFIYDGDSPAPRGWKLLRQLSQVGIKDECSCWCSLDGKGCTPFLSIWKSYAGTNADRNRVFHTYFNHVRHVIFHDGIVFAMKENGPPNALLEFLRFITFEALGMQHTCCALSEVNSLKSRCRTLPEDFDYLNRKESIVLAHRSPEKIKSIHFDDQEQENARILESLMKDFTEKLKTMESSPRVLETFLWGYWRRRISRLYSVDAAVINEMGREVGNIKTHILPERVLKFLGEGFELLRLDTQQASRSGNNDEDASTVEDIGLSPHCKVCDDSYMSDTSDVSDGYYYDESDDE
ncbi:hypothetical protein F4805DRAFT_474075 [Annulohypoxylon moriforme]|nr:hypothetical protein F4805DRAFT_474075 [Annulohypoxylon moriforme]